MIKPGDLVKHADWAESPVNSYRDGIGFVSGYEKGWHEAAAQKRWVVVQWLPYDPNTCNTIYHVDSLVRYDECCK